MARLRLRNQRDLSGLDANDPSWNVLKSSIVKGLKVYQTTPKKRLRTVRRIIPRAGNFEFECDGQEESIQVFNMINDLYVRANHRNSKHYFLRRYNYKLILPNAPGVETAQGEVLPFEICEIAPGQPFRKRPSADVMRGLLELSKDNPKQRLSNIERGLRVSIVTSHGNSRLTLLIGHGDKGLAVYEAGKHDASGRARENHRPSA